MYERLSIALNRRRDIHILLRLLILAFLAGLLFEKFRNNPFPDFLLTGTDLITLLTIVFLVPANLALEAQKWRVLIGKHRLTFNSALRGVVLGICSGLFTPNRSGEFIGRQSVLDPIHKKRGVAQTFTGSFLQGSITIVMGVIGFIHFDISLTPARDILGEIAPFAGIILSLIFCSFLIFNYRKGIRIKQWRRYFILLRPRQIGRAYLYGILRYAVFSVQFVLALYAFGFEASVGQAFSGVFFLFFAQTYLPGSFLSELGVREILSVFIFGSFFANPLMAPLAAFFVWLANIALPSFSGVFIRSSFKSHA